MMRLRFSLPFLMALALAFAYGCSDTSVKKSRGDTTERRYFHQDFMRSEGVPVYEGFSLDTVDSLVLGEWPRLGTQGSYISLHGQQGYTNAYFIEVAPGKTTLPERHIYEEVLYVYEGQGETSIWHSERAANKSRLKYQAGALFSPPLNSWHRHRNTGTEPLRLLAVTNAPPVLDLFRDSAFVHDNPHSFSDRWNGNQNYFAPGPLEGDEGSRGNGRAADPFRVNFVPDLFALDHLMHDWRQKRMSLALFLMSGNALSPHISTWAPRDYQTAHYHNGGATVILLKGEGYYMMWPGKAGSQPFADGHADKVVQGPLKPGGMYSPPGGWYHQHFNTSDEPALYLALTPQGRKHRLMYVRKDHNDAVWTIEKEATAYPVLIEIEDEDPRIGELFEEALEAQ